VPSRTEFQQLADTRVAEAAALLATGHWSGAYYLTGYSVEFALKACILARVERTGIIFEDKKFAADCWTHDIEKLVSLADLIADRDADAPIGSQRWRHWGTVRDWDESSRYSASDQARAEALFRAITDPTDGVLPWIRARW
jgi:hypothetical protein